MSVQDMRAASPDSIPGTEGHETLGSTPLLQRQYGCGMASL